MKFSTKQALTVVVLIAAGLYLVKRAKVQATTGDQPQAKTADWWQYAGSWGV